MLSIEEFEKVVMYQMNDMLQKQFEEDHYSVAIKIYNGSKVITLVDCEEKELEKRVEKYKAYALSAVDLKMLYDRYQDHEPMDQIVVHSLSSLLSHQEKFYPSLLIDYSYVKENMVVACINAKLFDQSNHMPIPHLKIADIVLHILIRVPPFDEDMYVVLTDDMFQEYRISKKKLFLDALECSSKNLPAEITPFKELYPDADKDSTAANDIYILNNPVNNQGSACMFYPSVIQNLINRYQSSFFVIPFSTSFAIVLPEYHDAYLDLFKFVLPHLIKREKEETKKLSKEIFYYDRRKKEYITLKEYKARYIKEVKANAS